MARKNAGTVPPYITLEESIEIVRDIYERGGGSMSLDDVASLIDSTVKSSAFAMKMGAMRAFGLILTDGKTVQLSSSGKSIVAPTSRQEQQAAVLDAFNAIAVYEGLHDKYKGGFLPEDTFLVNTVAKEFSSPPEHRGKWIKSFKESGRAAGLLRDEGGKIRVLQTPSLIGGVMPELRHEEQRQQPREEGQHRPDREQQSPINDHLFPVVLDDSKRTAYVPLDLSKEDLDYLKGVLDLWLARKEAKAKTS